MEGKIVLVVSIAVQFACAVYALLLMRFTGAKRAWIAMSIAFFIMGVRRVIPLAEILSDPSAAVDLRYEGIGLVLSAFALVGVVGIRPIFREWRTARERVQSLLDEKELLLKEVHHRVKNNLGTVISMLRLQASSVGDRSSAKELEEAAGRVATMSLLYEKLFVASDYRSVSSRDYLSTLIDELVSSFPGADAVSVEISVDDFSAKPNFIQMLGLIVNEALTNVFKYAFEPGQAGHASVRVSLRSPFVDVSVADDGRGLPAPGSVPLGTGFGATLITVLVEQMGGVLEVAAVGSGDGSCSGSGGTVVKFSVPLPPES